MDNSNFKFLSFGLDVTKLRKELKDNDHLWSMVASLQDIGGDQHPTGFLPLVMGVQEPGKRIKDSEGLRCTSAITEFPELFKVLDSFGVVSVSRCAFFKLPPGGAVKSHIDDGSYYHGKDRFHLSIQGDYEYGVGDERHVIKPGTLFWFDNKKLHNAKNVSNIDRLTFVFDVPYNQSPIRNNQGQLI